MLWPGISWTCSSMSQCWSCQLLCLFGVPGMHSLCAPRAEPFTSVLGWTDGLMGAFKFFAWKLELWSLIPKINFWFISAVFSLGKVFSAKGSESSGCPCAPGFGLTLCVGREADHVPEQWGYPGRPSCRWQQTDISHYTFPLSEGYSLSA